MAWWFMPGVMLATGMYVRHKVKSAKVRWLNMSEEDAKKLPTIAAIAKSDGGDVLPEAPEGFRWKEIQLIYSASPFAPQSTFKVNVLAPWLANNVPTGTQGYAGFSDLRALLTTQNLRTAPYLGTPPRPPNESAGAAVLKQVLQDMLRQLPPGAGIIKPVKGAQIQRGDLAVTQDCRLGRVVSTPLVYYPNHIVALTEIYPNKGRKLMVPYAQIQCAFGVRRRMAL